MGSRPGGIRRVLIALNIIPSGYFDAFHMIEQLFSVPLQVIIGNV